MTIKYLAWTAGAALFLLVSRAGNADSLSPQDRKFIDDAAKGGMMEVHMGHVGLEHASSPAVKSFAQRIVDDHTKGNGELMSLAKQKGVTLPTDNPAGMPSKLSSKTGSDFDKEYVKMMVDDHEKDIAAFEKEAKGGSDPDVKRWATQTLPTLRGHLDAAKALNP